MGALVLIAVGLVVGLVSGLWGIGGGTIVIPFLVYVFKMDIHHAIGTSLAVIVPTALVGAWRYSAAGEVDWKTALAIALFSVVGSIAGVALALKIPASLLKKTFALFLIAVALKMLFEKR